MNNALNGELVKIEAANLINESLKDIDSGGELTDADEFLKEMKKKYGE